MEGGTYQGLFEIISYHGRLLQGYTNGEMHASQKLNNRGDEETWELYTYGNKVALRNYRTKRYLCGEPSGKAVADRDWCREWELWTMHKLSPSTFAFKSAHGYWLCAQPPGDDIKWGGEVCADRSDLREWETFNVHQTTPPQNSSPWWKQVLEIAVKAGPVLIG
jgi:hypothetical protein